MFLAFRQYKCKNHMPPEEIISLLFSLIETKLFSSS
jgi:hypothetical protein